jgi:hypothetical protein
MPDPGSSPDPTRGFTPDLILRRFSHGVLLADPRALRVRYIVDPVTGEPVMACAPDAGESEDWRLFIPDESDGGLMVAGHPVALDARADGVCDRWVAYHGRPETPRFFRLAVEWGRIGERTFDAEETRLINPFADQEAGLLRAIRREASLGGVVLGVDDLGLDVRAGPHVRRLAFAACASNADEVLAMVRRLVSEGDA